MSKQICKMVSDKIIAMLERGTVPWYDIKNDTITVPLLAQFRSQAEKAIAFILGNDEENSEEAEEEN
jgi:hypothetical protein